MNEDDNSGDIERECHAAQHRAASQDLGTALDKPIAQHPHLELTVRILLKDGMTYKEIVVMMEITEAAANVLLARARGRTETLLSKVENKEFR